MSCQPLFSPCDDQYLERKLKVREKKHTRSKRSLCSQFLFTENFLVMESFVWRNVVLKCFVVFGDGSWNEMMLTFGRWWNLRCGWMTRTKHRWSGMSLDDWFRDIGREMVIVALHGWHEKTISTRPRLIGRWWSRFGFVSFAPGIRSKGDFSRNLHHARLAVGSECDGQSIHPVDRCWPSLSPMKGFSPTETMMMSKFEERCRSALRLSDETIWPCCWTLDSTHRCLAHLKLQRIAIVLSRIGSSAKSANRKLNENVSSSRMVFDWPMSVPHRMGEIHQEIQTEWRSFLLAERRSEFVRSHLWNESVRISRLWSVYPHVQTTTRKSLPTDRKLRVYIGERQKRDHEGKDSTITWMDLC